jgi:hypothetical protein
MANADRPSGLSPVKHLNGAPWNGQANVYCIPAASTSGFAIGDPVISGGDADANGVPTIALAAATGAIRGVIVGLGTKESLMANPSNLDSTVRPAAAQSIDWYAMVVDDPMVVFEAQEVSGGTALTSAAVGLNTNLTLGTNNGYVSGWEVDNATEATTATLQVKLLGLARRRDNAFGEHAKWLVKINNHELNAGTGKAGL